jgi:hypothetical protein
MQLVQPPARDAPPAPRTSDSSSPFEGGGVVYAALHTWQCMAARRVSEREGFRVRVRVSEISPLAHHMSRQK